MLNWMHSFFRDILELVHSFEHFMVSLFYMSPQTTMSKFHAINPVDSCLNQSIGIQAMDNALSSPKKSAVTLAMNCAEMALIVSCLAESDVQCFWNGQEF